MKADLNSIFQAFSGNIENIIFRQMSDGSVVIAKKPKPYPKTEAQRRAGERMRRAHQAAKEIIANDPVKTAIYQAYANTLKNCSLRHAIVRDILSPPRIHNVYRHATSHTLCVEASDNHRLEQVEVSFFMDGALLSRGAAQPDLSSYQYSYPLPPTAGYSHIQIAVTDFAGNTTRKNLEATDLEDR